MQRIGLTGSIGSGKSSVANLLSAAGLVVLDADAIARQVSKQADTLAEVRAALGDEYVLEQDLNRPALAKLVFHQPEKRQILGQIIHPKVRQAITDAEQQHLAQNPNLAWIVHDVPLLIENKLHERMDVVVVVDAPVDIRAARVQQRDGLSMEDFTARDASQMPSSEKCQYADLVIQNDGDWAHLEQQVQQLLHILQEAQAQFSVQID